MSKGYDPKCYELAEYFLSDHKINNEESRQSLAQDIQDAVEMWFTGAESEGYVPPKKEGSS